MSGIIGGAGSKSGFIGESFGRTIVPSFHAVGNSFTANGGDVEYSNVLFNQGGHYDGTKNFTAPVTGVYSISWSLKGTSSGISVYSRVKIDGTSTGPGLEFLNDITSAHTHMSFIHRLLAGQVIKIGSGSNVLCDGSDSFSVCLLG